MLSMSQWVPYIAFQMNTERSNPCDLKAYGRLESYESDPSQGTLQKDLDYVHIPTYTIIGGISAYVRGYRGKRHVYHSLYGF